MEMKRIEADTLEEAYSEAAKELACSVTEIKYEIIQHPTTGMMGLFKKTAIIVAVKKNTATPSTTTDTKPKSKGSRNPSITVTPKKKLDQEEKVENTNDFKKHELKTLVVKEDKIVDGFFDEKNEEVVEKTANVVSEKAEVITEEKHFDDDREHPKNREMSVEIESKIKKILSVACFEIDTIEVDVFNGIAHIFIDGEDAALLIGKEGYRYNALSYMLFNWINSHYDLYIKLEIAEFIQAQEEMIDNYLKPIAAHILEHGRGKTKPLDGILVQIALEKLRAMFPNKYIAIKVGKDAKKFIIINDFNTRKPTS